MKKILLLIIIIIELIIIKIPPYVELNNLAIIEEIAVIKESNTYTLILKEIIPIKDDQGISYEYKYYKKSASSLKRAYKNIKTDTKKKLYLAKTKSLITNIKYTDDIINTLEINPKIINHSSKNILTEIKS